MLNSKSIYRVSFCLFLTFLTSGCLKDQASLTGVQNSTLSSGPYLACDSLSDQDIFERSQDNAELISNGSFEEGHTQTGKSWKAYYEFGEWKVLNEVKTSPFEVFKDDGAGILAQDGRFKVELDSNDNSAMEQTVSVEQGKTYTLSLYYTPRHPNNQRTNPVEVLINDTVVMSLDTEGVKAWQRYEVNHTAQSNTLDLKLRAIGASDSSGGLVDNISLVEVGLSGASNLISNPSFEEGTDFDEGSRKWKYYTSIPGWTAVENEIIDQLEIQTGAVGGVEPQDGITKTELDAFKRNIKLYQDIETENGKKYVLRFYYSPRVVGNSDTNRAEVYFNDQKIVDLNGTERGWVEVIRVIDSDTDLSKLEFHGLGAEDGRGAFIDNVSLKEVNCELESGISINLNIKDLPSGATVENGFISERETTVVKFDVNGTKSNKAIKDIKWTYGSSVSYGWEFRTYMSAIIGNTVQVEVEDVDGFKETKTAQIFFADECELLSGGYEYELCLKTNSLSLDGNYINPLSGIVSFSLSNSLPLENNIVDPKVYLVEDDGTFTEERYDITSLVSFSGSILSFDPLSLVSLDIDPSFEHYIALVGDYENIVLDDGVSSTNARSKSFKFGVSALSLNFSESVDHLTVYNTDGSFGQTAESIGTSYSIATLPPGQYTVSAKNQDKVAFANFAIEPLETVTANFLMQETDPRAAGRLSLNESYEILRAPISLDPQNLTVNSLSNEILFYPEGLVYMGDFNEETLQCPDTSFAKKNQYYISRFQENFEKLKRRFKGVEDDTLPEALGQVFVNRVNGDVPGYTLQPDELKDLGANDEGIPVLGGLTYNLLLFGEHPLLHRAKSKFHVDFSKSCCIERAQITADFINQDLEPDDPNRVTKQDVIMGCNSTYDETMKVWDEFERMSDPIEVNIEYVLTGEIDDEPYEEIKTVTFKSKDFIKENGGLDEASLNWIFSEEVGDGWLLQQPTPIEIPENLEEAKITLELKTSFPENIAQNKGFVEDQDFVFYMGAVLIEEPELPTITDYIKHSNTTDSRSLSVKTDEQHANLILDQKGLFPIDEDNFFATKVPNKSIYNGQSLRSKFRIKTVGIGDRFEIKGVHGHIYHGNNKHPNTDIGVELRLGSSNFQETENENEFLVTIDRDDFFPSGSNYDSELRDNLSLELGLIVLDTGLPAPEEIKGPIAKTIQMKPSYNVSLGSYNKPIHSYSDPNGVHGSHSMLGFFRDVANSDLNTGTASNNSFLFNDVSLPFGGEFIYHSGHRLGENIDIRYPHPNNQFWDETVNAGSAVNSFCTENADFSRNPSDVRHHGYRKFNAIRKYLWIKFYAKRIYDNYQNQFIESMRGINFFDPGNDHKSPLLSYIGNNFCDETSGVGKDLSECIALRRYYTVAIINEVDALVSYISVIREGMEQIASKAQSYGFNVRTSDGAGLLSCFPNSDIGLTYSREWHKEILQNGKFPDGAMMKINSNLVGPWSSKPNSIIFFRNDTAHLSHIDIGPRKRR